MKRTPLWAIVIVVIGIQSAYAGGKSTFQRMDEAREFRQTLKSYRVVSTKINEKKSENKKTLPKMPSTIKLGGRSSTNKPSSLPKIKGTYK